MTTKEQERQAIAKIRRIVEGLGENSYVGTAMDGVLEVAEQNIADDAAYSMKERMEIAERREQEQRERAEKLEKELKALKERYELLANQKQQQEERLIKQLQESQKWVERYEMPKAMFEGLEQILEEYKGRAEIGMSEAAILMAECVGEATVSPGIHDAAKRFRERRATATKCRTILKELKERYEIVLMS